MLLMEDVVQQDWRQLALGFTERTRDKALVSPQQDSDSGKHGLREHSAH